MSIYNRNRHMAVVVVRGLINVFHVYLWLNYSSNVETPMQVAGK